jgi:HPt (histidine-containing phosphotransfer) domain-containing protein
MRDEGDINGVTNLDYLKKLSKGNEQFVKDMIRIFLEENPGEIEMLEDAIKDKDFRRINSYAHKLRSTVPFVGIDRMIADDISQIEQLALEKAGNPLDQAPVEAAPAKSSFLPTDRELLRKIESLFAHIKKICGKAYDELKPYAGLQ